MYSSHCKLFLLENPEVGCAGHQDLKAVSFPEWGAMDGAAKAIKDASLNDYLDCLGEWDIAKTPEPNQELGRIVAELARACLIPEPDTCRSRNEHLKLAIVGAPFSGKSSISKRLAEEFHLKLIEPRDSISARSNPTVHTEQIPESEF